MADEKNVDSSIQGEQNLSSLALNESGYGSTMPASSIRWGAIFLGTLVGLSTEVLLNFLGMGLGLTSFDMTADSMFKLGVGTIIWLAISGIISMALAGFVVGKFSNLECKGSRAFHGFFAWSFATLITVLATTTAGSALIGGPSNIVKSSIQSAGQQSVRIAVGMSDQYSANQGPRGSVTNEEPAPAQTAEKTMENMGRASFIFFIAFLLSALSSSMMAYMIRPKRLQV